MTSPNRILVHTTEMPVRWCDMDAFGHVNNSVYFSYFEIARVEWWHKAIPDNVHFNDMGPVLVNASCIFHKPILYPENLSVSLYVGPPGRSSYECFYEIRAQADSSILYAEGITKVVWIDRNTGKSVELPEYLRQHLPMPV
jgi:acyl-CoA thioester hydrolase